MEHPNGNPQRLPQVFVARGLQLTTNNPAVNDGLDKENTMIRYSGNFATTAQLNFIDSLVRERVVPAGLNTNPTRKVEASNVIKELLRAPKKTYIRSGIGDFVETVRPTPTPVPSEVLVPGVYETGGQIYVVKFNKEKTGLYAKRLVVVGNGVTRRTEAGDTVKAIEFVYAAGAVYNIRLADRMPVERAKELITLYGQCIACGKHLKAAKSVEQGIGPVCIKKFGPVLGGVEAITVDGREVAVA
jgi:hypothetical protein